MVENVFVHLTFFVSVVSNGDGVITKGEDLSIENVSSHIQELGRGDQATLVGEYI